MAFSQPLTTQSDTQRDTQTEQSRKVLDDTIRRVRGRWRIQWMLDGVVLSLIPAAVLLLISLILGRLELAPKLAQWLLMGAGSAVGLGLLVGAVWPLPPLRVALTIDQRAGLQDRLSSALQFLEQPQPSPFAQAAIWDAAQVAEQVQPAQVLPWRFPQGLRELSLTLLAFVVVPWIHPPKPIIPVSPTVRKTPSEQRVKLSAEELSLYRRDDLTEQQIRQLQSPELETIHRAIQDLWRNLEAGHLSRQEFFRRLAQLQQKMAAFLRTDKTKDAKKAAEKLEQLAQQLSKTKQTKNLAQALRAGEASRSTHELQKLSKDLQKKALSRSDRKKVANAYRQIAQHMNQPHQKHMKNLAQQLQQKGKLSNQPSTTKTTQQAAQQLQQMIQRSMQQRALQNAQQQLQQMKQSIQQQSIGGSQRTQQLRQFMQRARGQQGQNQQQQQQGGKQQQQGGKQQQQQGGKQQQQGGNQQQQGGNQQQQGGNQRQGSQQGQGQGRQGQSSSPSGTNPGNGQGQGGKQWGTGEGKDPFGKPTDNIAQDYQEDQLSGQKGSGPSRRTVIEQAGSAGFSKGTYRKVYRAYQRVSEDVMNEKRVPATHRQMVKRYFQLIQPR